MQSRWELTSRFFAPKREANNPLVFGSVHTNIGHLDGCSGIAALAKLTLTVQHQAMPPLVHFRTLHPLVTGSLDGSSQARRMGHTWKNVDVKGFAAAWPKQLVQLVPRESSAATGGVSSFGFGGSMAHVIVAASDGPAALMAPCAPIWYRNMRRLTWTIHVEGSEAQLARAQRFTDQALSYIGDIVTQAAAPLIKPGARLAAGAHLFDELGLDQDGAVSLRNDLNDRLGMTLPGEIVHDHPTAARLAAGIMQCSLSQQLTQGNGVRAFLKGFLDVQAARQVLDRHAPEAARAPPAARKNSRPMVFVLAGPRSGSSLLQLMLNRHPKLFAPQELYLLHFHTMEERRRRLRGAELERWIHEGLLKTVMELHGCDAEQGTKMMEVLAGATTQEVYRVLQEWAAPHILVDKTPPSVWSKETLHRAEDLFDKPLYIHLHRHPYPNIESMTREAVNRNWIRDTVGTDEFKTIEGDFDDTLWQESESMWATGNSNVIDFFGELDDPDRCLTVRYEDLVRQPEAESSRICAFLGLEDESAAMSLPYTAENRRLFEPAREGGLATTDPHLLQRQAIDPSLADAWILSKVVRPLSPFAAHVATELGHHLPVWKEPELRAGVPAELTRLNRWTSGAPIIFVHGLSGEVGGLSALAALLPCPAFGLRLRGAAAKATTVEALAQQYGRALARLDLPDGTMLCGYGFGARVAHRMACVDATLPRLGALVLMDGPITGAFDSLPFTAETMALFYACRDHELGAQAGAGDAKEAPVLDQFGSHLRQVRNADEALDFVASWRPPSVTAKQWNAHVENAVQAYRRLLALARQPAKATPSGALPPMVLTLVSDAGARAAFGSRNREACGPHLVDHIPGANDLLDPRCIDVVASALRARLGLPQSRKAL